MAFPARVVASLERPWSGSFAGQVLEQGVEVFELGVLDNDFAAAVMVFNVDLEAQGSLQAFLDLADIGIDGRLWFNFFLCRFFRVDETLDVVLCLANRERKCGYALSDLFHLLGVF